MSKKTDRYYMTYIKKTEQAIKFVKKEFLFISAASYVLLPI